MCKIAANIVAQLTGGISFRLFYLKIIPALSKAQTRVIQWIGINYWIDTLSLNPGFAAEKSRNSTVIW